MSASTSTTFRDWMTHLVSPRGAEAEWPWLLREMLIAEFIRQRDVGVCYAGEVFKDRDGDYPHTAVLPEKKAVKDLYHGCRLNSGRVYRIGEERYWLLGYEWPNQGGDKEKLQRADLVGLNRVGGLVVFECKLQNPYGPLAAVLEGLDYLSCLTSVPNFAKVVEGFCRCVSKPGFIRPEEFGSVTPSQESLHEVIVLASAEYYSQYRTSKRGTGWEKLAALPPSPSAGLSIRFAESDFAAPEGRWVTG